MIGIILIYFLGKKFYELAIEYDRAKWLFAILGVVSYYVGSFIGAFVILLIYELNSDQYLDDMTERLLGLLGIPFGLLACWGFYRILKNNWSKPNTPDLSSDILD